MAVKSGFFNSQSGDRLYDANDINDFFAGFATEGVLSTVDEWLQVIIGGGMSVVVGKGKAWFRNTWLRNTQALTLDIAAADANYDRWDTVILEFNSTDRVNEIRVITGIPDQQDPQPPSLISTSTLLQVRLADIAVPAGATDIQTSWIYNKIGTADCPFSTGLLQQASIDDLMLQFTSDYYAWRFDLMAMLEEIDTSGTLQEITDIKQRIFKGRNFLINGGFNVNQRGITQVTGYNRTAFIADNYALLDRWSYALSSTNVGVWTLQRYELANKFGFRATNTTAGGSLAADDYVMLRQVIESSHIADISKGRSNASPLVLRFTFKTNMAGNYVVELKDAVNSRFISYTFYHPGDGGKQTVVWEIDPDFTGQLYPDPDAGLILSFWIAAGSDYTNGGTLQTEWDYAAANQGKRAVGQVLGHSTVGKYYEWTDVQLEIGVIPTSFEIRSIADELINCQRYMEYYSTWEQIAYNNTTVGNAILYAAGHPYAVVKRELPSISADTYSYMLYGTGFVGALTYGGAFTILNGFEDLAHFRYYFNASEVLDPGAYFFRADQLMIDCEYPTNI